VGNYSSRPGIVGLNFINDQGPVHKCSEDTLVTRVAKGGGYYLVSSTHDIRFGQVTRHVNSLFSFPFRFLQVLLPGIGVHFQSRIAMQQSYAVPSILAKREHDEMEKYYVPYMDFEAINARREQTLARILNLAAQVNGN